VEGVSEWVVIVLHWPWELLLLLLLLLLALGLPPGGTMCLWFDTYDACVPRPISSTRGNRDPGGPTSALVAELGAAMTTICNYLATPSCKAKAPKPWWIYVHHIWWWAPLPIGVEWSSYTSYTMGSQVALAYWLSSLVLHHVIYVEISDNPQKSNTLSVEGCSQASAVCTFMNWAMCYSMSTSLVKWFESCECMLG
jgi:hypothetical protein